MITDEAVEAAADRVVELRRDGQALTDMEFARALLEAAAPHVLATGLAEAAEQMRAARLMWCLDDVGRYWIKRTLDELAERAEQIRPTP